MKEDILYFYILEFEFAWKAVATGDTAMAAAPKMLKEEEEEEEFWRIGGLLIE